VYFTPTFYTTYTHLTHITLLNPLKEYPRPLSRDSALGSVLAALAVQAQTLLLPHYHTHGSLGPADSDFSRFSVRGGEGDEMLVELCTTLTCIASGEMQLLTTGYSSEDAHIQIQAQGQGQVPRADAIVVTFFNTLMGVIRIRPRKMASSSFDYWAEVTDIPQRQWHPYIETVLGQLLGAVVSHATYPSDAKASTGMGGSVGNIHISIYPCIIQHGHLSYILNPTHVLNPQLYIKPPTIY